jgi:hypothetical protein
MILTKSRPHSTFKRWNEQEASSAAMQQRCHPHYSQQLGDKKSSVQIDLHQTLEAQWLQHAEVHLL